MIPYPYATRNCLDTHAGAKWFWGPEPPLAPDLPVCGLATQSIPTHVRRQPDVFGLS